MRIGKVHLIELGYLDFAVVVATGHGVVPLGRSSNIRQQTSLSVRYNELDSELMEERRVQRARDMEREQRAEWNELTNRLRG